MGANNGVENALPNLNCDLMKTEQKLLCHLKIALKFVLLTLGQMSNFCLFYYLADIALTRWVMSIDTYKPTATEPLDQEILKKLDNGFRRLTWARRQFSQSLLKRFLVKSVFHTLKHRQTSGNINLYDIAKSGFEHLDSKIGVFAHNEECYKVFKPILHPVICTIHQATPLASHPKESNWSDIEHLEVELDPEGKYIDKITMTVSKNITPYPFVPSMTKSQFESLEREIRGTMKTMTTLTGVYYSLGSIPKDVKLILGREDLIFDNAGDKFLETAGVFNHWPAGRGVFLTHMKDVFIWINQLEHFTLGVTQKGGANIKNVFHRLFQTLQSINDSLRWSRDDFWGLVTMSPALIGSGLKIYVYVKLPYLGQEESFRQDLLDQYGLECVKAKHTLSDNRIFVLSNRRTFGLTESEILSSVHRCLKEMITIEQKFKDSAAKEREA